MISYNVFSGSSARRKEIIKLIAQHNGICANREWCMNTQRDPDLKQLLKRGLIAQTRKDGAGGIRHTYLVLTKAGRQYAKRNKLI